MDRVEEMYVKLVRAPHHLKCLIAQIIALEDRIAALEASSAPMDHGGFKVQYAPEFERAIGYYGELYATTDRVVYRWVFSTTGVYTEYKDKHWCRTGAPREMDAAAHTLAKKLGWLK